MATIEDGRTWALAHQADNADACYAQNKGLLFEQGCRIQVLQTLGDRSAQNPQPRPRAAHSDQGRFVGRTTADCQAEVEQTFATMKAECRSEQCISANFRRYYLIEMGQCENFDKTSEGEMLTTLTARLDTALDAQAKGQVLNDAERAFLVQEAQRVAAVKYQEPMKRHVQQQLMRLGVASP
jgi:hypothetical protein